MRSRLIRFLRRWGPTGFVALSSILVFIWKVRVVAPIQYVGHADASAYAEMADSILKGRGLEVDYISWYFRKYAPGIIHPEDHWPPFYDDRLPSSLPAERAPKQRERKTPLSQNRYLYIRRSD